MRIDRPRVAVAQGRHVRVPAGDRTEHQARAIAVAGGDAADPVRGAERDRFPARAAQQPDVVIGLGHAGSFVVRRQLTADRFRRRGVEFLKREGNAPVQESLPNRTELRVGDFPQAIVRCRQALSICASNSVVVVLPFVPVTAIIESSQDRKPSSSSPIISMFREEKFRASAEVGSIPGLRTTRSYLLESPSAAGPQITRMPCARRLSMFDLRRSFSSALSSTVTLAPSAFSKCAPAEPLKPAPRTATF